MRIGLKVRADVLKVQTVDCPRPPTVESPVRPRGLGHRGFDMVPGDFRAFRIPLTGPGFSSRIFLQLQSEQNINVI